MNTIAWRSPTSPLPTENNPRLVFERLFGNGGTTAQRVALAQREPQHPGLGDGGLLAPCAHARRRRTARTSTTTSSPCARSSGASPAVENLSDDAGLPALERPRGIPEKFGDHVKLMYELQWLAFQADLTRVVTFMLGRELNFRTYPEIGFNEGHHGVSHHGDRPEQIEKLARLNTYQTELFAGFLAKLKATPEGDGTLLDHSLFLYGASLSNPNLHAHYDLPLTLVGGAGGALEGNRHVVFPAETPMANLLLSMLDKVGVPTRVARRQHGARSTSSRALAARPSLRCSLRRALPAPARQRPAICSQHAPKTATALRRARCSPSAPMPTTPMPTARRRCIGPCTMATPTLVASAARRGRQGRRAQSLRRAAAVPRRRERRRRDGEAAARRAAPMPNTALPEGETVLMTAARTGDAATLDALIAARRARQRRREAGRAKRR